MQPANTNEMSLGTYIGLVPKEYWWVMHNFLGLKFNKATNRDCHDEVGLEL